MFVQFIFLMSSVRMMCNTDLEVILLSISQSDLLSGTDQTVACATDGTPTELFLFSVVFGSTYFSLFCFCKRFLRWQIKWLIVVTLL